MQFAINTVLLVLVLFQRVHAAPPVTSPRCAGAVATHSEVVALDANHAITITTHTCPNAVVAKRDVSPDTSIVRSLDIRQTNSCTNPPPTCQADVPCNTNICTAAYENAPALADCNIILKYLETLAGTFFLNPQTYISAIYQTCEFALGYRGTTGQLEYPYFNWGSLGGALYTNCISVRRFGGAACISDSNLYFVE
ncbi:hypothetical protein BDQ12DRAFT_722739 [Crucibulum laeve]|uniref:Uncharacterized protein n=1 Tax=Crucibulum laeve TaxID=68775 RepID=A0A5C3M0C4_9AGAR|nr:hypothetical protein BDQ12DRAFT_722739 [Crucibulum laeve]